LLTIALLRSESRAGLGQPVPCALRVPGWRQVQCHGQAGERLSREPLIGVDRCAVVAAVSRAARAYRCLETLAWRMAARELGINRFSAAITARWPLPIVESAVPDLPVNVDRERTSAASKPRSRWPAERSSAARSRFRLPIPWGLALTGSLLRDTFEASGAVPVQLDLGATVPLASRHCRRKGASTR
jgi:hypothetical protein